MQNPIRKKHVIFKLRLSINRVKDTNQINGFYGDLVTRFAIVVVSWILSFFWNHVYDFAGKSPIRRVIARVYETICCATGRFTVRKVAV